MCFGHPLTPGNCWVSPAHFILLENLLPKEVVVGIKLMGEEVTIHREMVGAGVDINYLAMEEITQDLLLWLVIGEIMMEGEGAEAVGTTEEATEEEDLGRE